MSASPNFQGLLLCTAVLSCATVSDALVLLVLLPVQLLICFVFSRGLSYLHVPTDTAVWVWAGGSGLAFLRLTVLTPYPVEIAPLTVAAFLLCGVLAPSFESDPPPPSLVWRSAAVMLLTGIVREIVTQGTVLGLTVIEPPAVTPEPVGSLLVAAFWLWLFRLPVPVTGPTQKTLWSTVWLTLAVCSVKAMTTAFLPTLSDSFVIGVTVLAAALLSRPAPLRTAWAPLIPVVAWPIADSWWHALAAAVITALLLSVCASLTERWRQRPVRRSFSGSPAALVLAAIGLSILSSF